MNNNLRNIYLVGRFTFLEVVRSKLMIFIPIVACGLIFISLVASSFAYGAPERIGIDMGLGIMSLTNLALSLFIGATLVSKEVDNKTIYMIISKPISRTSFLAGKILGLSLVLIINVLSLTLVSSAIYFFFKGELNSLVFFVGIFSFFEAFIVLLFSILFSLMTNISLTVIFTIFVWIMGSVITETKTLMFTKISSLVQYTVDFFSYFLPDFSKFNIKDFLIYKQSLEMSYLGKTSLYFLCYAIFLFLIVDLVFKKKDFN